MSNTVQTPAAKCLQGQGRKHTFFRMATAFDVLDSPSGESSITSGTSGTCVDGSTPSAPNELGAGIVEERNRGAGGGGKGGVCMHHAILTFSMRWPRAMTSDGRADAARADTTAYRFWLRLIFLCHRRQTFVGANIRPPRHMLPKAPWPARCVPPPGTRGIRDTARPVPQDEAAVCMPASKATA